MKRQPILRSAIVAALAAVVLLLAGDSERAHAVMTSQNVVIGTRVDTRCMILVAGFTFPSTYVTGQAAPLDGVGSIFVDCDAGRRASVRLDQGVNPAPGSTARNPRRRMRLGASTNYMTYNLYEDAARTVVWDDDRPGVKSARAWPVNIPVYGRIDGGQTVFSGLYSDTIVASLFF